MQNINTKILQILVTEDEKNNFTKTCESIGLMKSQSIVLIIHGMVSLYQEKGDFFLLDLVRPSKEKRDLKIQVSIPEKLDAEMKEISNTLNISMSQLGLMGIYTFIENYSKTGTNMLKEVLNTDYRTK